MAKSGHHRGQGKNQQRHELVAAAGWAVLVVVIAVLSTWAHHSLSTARPAASHAAVTQPANSFSPPLPMGTQVHAWLNDAEPSINALFIAADNIVATATQADIAGTAAACQSAAGAAANLQHHLPSPDPALTTALQQAIDSYQVGIRHCISGTQNRDAVIGEATVYINQGSTDLQEAVDILNGDLSSDARDTPVLTA